MGCVQNMLGSLEGWPGQEPRVQEDRPDLGAVAGIQKVGAPPACARMGSVTLGKLRCLKSSEFCSGEENNQNNGILEILCLRAEPPML